MSDRRGKKRPKSYYRKSSHTKRQKLNSLAVGMRGFLVTCNNNEKQAVRESYNILNEYADELYGPEKLQGEKDDNSDMSASADEEDMEKAMEKELKAIKEQQKTRRFQNTDTNAKNCIFIRSTLDDPTELHHKIFSDLFEKKVSKARFAMRMLPIAGSCKAVLGEIKRLAEDILPKYFPSELGEERTYSVVFKVRNNNGVSRDSVLPMLGDIVKSLNPLNRVNCDNPDVVILVEVICSVCCLGVGTDFYKFRKYNLHEVVKDDKEKQNKDDKEKQNKEDKEKQNTDDKEKQDKDDKEKQDKDDKEKQDKDDKEKQDKDDKEKQDKDDKEKQDKDDKEKQDKDDNEKQDKEDKEKQDFENKSESVAAGEANPSSVEVTEDKCKSVLKVRENVDEESKPDGVGVTERSTPSPVTVHHCKTESVEVVDQKSKSVSSGVTPDDKNEHGCDDLSSGKVSVEVEKTG